MTDDRRNPAHNFQRLGGTLGEMSAISNAEKLACAKRELQMRENVYPRWIDKGKLTNQKAQHQLAVMRAIVEDYKKLVDAERLL